MYTCRSISRDPPEAAARSHAMFNSFQPLFRRLVRNGELSASPSRGPDLTAVISNPYTISQRADLPSRQRANLPSRQQVHRRRARYTTDPRLMERQDGRDFSTTACQRIFGRTR